MERISEGSREGSASSKASRGRSLLEELLERGDPGRIDEETRRSWQRSLMGEKGDGTSTHRAVHVGGTSSYASGVHIEQLNSEDDEEPPSGNLEAVWERQLRMHHDEKVSIRSAAAASASSVRVKELERQLQEVSMQSAPSASSLRVKELERQLQEVSMQPAPSASSLRVKELETQLQEMQSAAAPSASSLRVKELETQLQEMQSAAAPSASSLRVKELERQLQEMQSAAAPSASALKVVELERQLREKQSAPSASALKVVELEKQLKEAKRSKDTRMGALERQLFEAKRDKDSKMEYLQAKHVSANATRKKEISSAMKRAKALDLAFVLDATLSMRKSIDMVKNKMVGIAEQVMSMYPDCLMRVAVALYRDYDSHGNDGCDFTTNFRGDDSTFVSALSKVEVLSGGDFAEDVFTGLERVAALSWSAATRVVVHVGDAPCHGTRFQDPHVGDDYPEGDKLGRNLRTLLDNIRSRCSVMVYFFCHLDPVTRKMLREFKKEAEPDHSWLEEAEFRDINEIPAKVVEVARRTIAMSIHSTVANGGLHRRKVIALQVDARRPTDPGWRGQAKEPTQRVYKHKMYDSLDALLLKVGKQRYLEVEEMPRLELEISRYPFSDEGMVRWPFFARATDVDGVVSSNLKVVKRFKDYTGEDLRKAHDQHLYEAQMEVQTVASHMADEFNRVTEMKNLRGVKRVRFGVVCTVQVKSRFYNMEDEVQGDWKRFNNNAGQIGQFAATLEAFSHWSLERSGGVLMVTDLQGVGTGGGSRWERTEYLLCDPAIHCEQDVSRFTMTNCGKEGFINFFETHKCNDICKHLGLKVGKKGFTPEGTHVR